MRKGVQGLAAAAKQVLRQNSCSVALVEKMPLHQAHGITATVPAILRIITN
jgi:hypothetical protein